MVENLHWLGGYSFKITGKKLIYINPMVVASREPPDIILICHEKENVCNPDTIEELAGPSSIVIAPNHAADDLSMIVRIAKPGETLDADGFRVETMPAYSVHSLDEKGEPFHPRKAKRKSH